MLQTMPVIAYLWASFVLCSELLTCGNTSLVFTGINCHTSTVTEFNDCFLACSFMKEGDDLKYFPKCGWEPFQIFSALIYSALFSQADKCSG